MPNYIENLVIFTGTPKQVLPLCTQPNVDAAPGDLNSLPNLPTALQGEGVLDQRFAGRVELGGVLCIAFTFLTAGDPPMPKLKAITAASNVTAHIAWSETTVGDSGYSRIYAGAETERRDGPLESRLPIVVLRGPGSTAAAFDLYGSEFTQVLSADQTGDVVNELIADAPDVAQLRGTTAWAALSAVVEQ